MKLHKIILALFIVLCPAGIGAQNIDPDSYAWGENVGWINFEPSYGPGVTVSDSDLTGFAWGENIGWINLSPSYGGVFNNGCGSLSGSAWAENVGWINFAPSGGGVSIDPETGLFSGHAWGENIGWINFAPTVAGVKTSWGGFDVVGDAGLAAILETKLTASDAADGDNFGHAVAFSGDVAVVGAPLDDDKGQSSGSAYVFRYNTATTDWTEEAKLTASDGADGDNLGRSIAISGDRIVVGSVLDDSAAPNAGSAYVFRYNTATATWDEEAELIADDAATGDRFGESVAINGDVAVVAAPFDDSFKGSVYVFRYNDVTGWAQEAKLVGADSVAGDRFGYSVAVGEDRIVVGSVLDDSAAPNAGSAYVFRYDTTIGWFQEAKKLTASDAAAGDNFGHSVAINGTTVAIGAPFAQGSGSVYVFKYELGFLGFHWVQKAELTASDAAAGQLFGTPITINGETIVAGSFADGHAGSYSGSAYVFGYSRPFWNEKTKLTASDAAADDWFGWSVAMSGDKVVVGALYNDDAGADSGSLYAFDLAAETPVGNCVSTTPIEPRTGRSPVTVTFSEVTQAGTTSLTTSSTGPSPPSGYQVGDPPTFYDITTTAESSGPITLDISYAGIVFENEEELEVFKLQHETSEWTLISNIIKTKDDTAKCSLDNLRSLFAIFERKSEPASVVIGGCDTGVPDQMHDGKLISGWTEDCATGAKNHGEFVSCIAHLTNDLKKFGLITDSEKGTIQSCAAQAGIP